VFVDHVKLHERVDVAATNSAPAGLPPSNGETGDRAFWRRTGLSQGDYRRRLGTALLPRVGKEGWGIAATAGMESGLGRLAAAERKGIGAPLLQRDAAIVILRSNLPAPGIERLLTPCAVARCLHERR
jgi:hypothetical protein